MPQKKQTTNFNVLTLSSILLVTTSVVGGLASIQPKEELKTLKDTPQVMKIEILEKNLPLPALNSKSVYAKDLETGKILLAINEKEPALPASTTKIATALVAMSYYDLKTVLTVGDIKKVEGQKMKLLQGERITVENLLYGLLVFSGNDAAEVLAQNYPGEKSNFVVVMNQISRDQGLGNTHFTNPQGYDEYLHFSSSEDLVKLSEYAMKNPNFAKIVGTKNYVVASVDGAITHEVASTNDLLKSMPGILGVKTGWTENSGEDLVTLYEKDKHRILMSVLGSSDRFGETKKILEWIFQNYEWVN
ncbi:MAG: serine hydrolase [Patescibacteria group bacterium]